MPWVTILNILLDVVVPEVHQIMTAKALAAGANPAHLPTLASVLADLHTAVATGNAQGQAFLNATAPPPPAPPAPPHP